VNNRRSTSEHLAFGMVVVVVCLNVLADVLPHLLLPLVVLALVAMLLRLAFFHSRRW
jgi:hypothetical protein